MGRSGRGHSDGTRVAGAALLDHKVRRVGVRPLDEQVGAVVQPAAAVRAREVLRVQVHQAPDARRARRGHLDPLRGVRARERRPEWQLVEVDVRRDAVERRGDCVDETVRVGALVRHTCCCSHEVEVAETCTVCWAAQKRSEETRVSTRYRRSTSGRCYQMR